MNNRKFNTLIKRAVVTIIPIAVLIAVTRALYIKRVTTELSDADLATFCGVFLFACVTVIWGNIKIGVENENSRDKSTLKVVGSNIKTGVENKRSRDKSALKVLWGNIKICVENERLKQRVALITFLVSIVLAFVFLWGDCFENFEGLSMLLFMVAGMTACASFGVWAKLYNEQRERINYECEAKRRMQKERWNDQMSKLGFSKEDSADAYNITLWISLGHLYEAESEFVYSLHYNRVDKVKYNCFFVSDIQFFSKEGDVQYTTKVFGGGSSIKGAVIGGLIAGDTGAVIGSRNKVTSQTVTHDERKTVIRISQNGGTVDRYYNGFEVYNYLLKKIPEKDLLTIQLNSAGKQKEEKLTVASNDDRKRTDVNNNDNFEERLLNIKSLYEKGLITQTEYDEKRKDLLKGI